MLLVLYFGGQSSLASWGLDFAFSFLPRLKFVLDLLNSSNILVSRQDDF